MGTKLRLLQANDDEFFLDCIDELYRTIEKNSEGFDTRRVIIKYPRLKSFLVRKISAIPALFKLRPKLKNLGGVNFVSMISGDFRLLIPHALTSRLNFIYMYDAWPRFHCWIFPLLDFFNVKWVFFSSKQVYEIFNKKYGHIQCKALWVPEALEIDDYKFKPANDRDIDVLEFGRMYIKYHELIKGALIHRGKKHIFKTPDMHSLFVGRSAFTQALASSRIVICVPSNITNPERSEFISTMTLRYLQAMASKCLIVGILPSDMEELFGYNPIVEIDISRAGNQILDILGHYDQYQPLIERNYQEVVASHQWKNRWLTMKQKMEEML